MASFGERLACPGWLAVVVLACTAVGGMEAAQYAPRVHFGLSSFEIYVQDRLFYLETNTYSLIDELQKNITGYESRIAALEATVVTLQMLIDALTPVDGGYTAWSVWSSCSVTCGDGMETRSRQCTDPAPANGGADCTALGDALETLSCGEPCSGSLRLVANDVVAETGGRLEIYFNDTWGTVCEDMFDSADSSVACSQLGVPGFSIPLTGAENTAQYGQGNGTIWLQNIQCIGTETRLEDCPNDGVGVTTCDHTKDVGVICPS